MVCPELPGTWQRNSGPSVRASIKKAVGLHMKGSLSSLSCTISRKWPALGGAMSPESARPQEIKTSEEKDLLNAVTILNFLSK